MNINCKFNNFDTEDEKSRFRLQDLIKNFSKFFPDHMRLHAVFTRKRNGKLQLSILTHAFDSPILVSAAGLKPEEVINHCFVKLFRAYNSTLIRIGQKQMLPLKSEGGVYERVHNREYREERAGGL